jgi:hypothetical protein
MSDTVVPPRLSPHAICATCRRPLNSSENLDAGGNIVSVEYSHPYEPPGTECHNLVIEIVGEDGTLDQISLCDFCSAPGPTWRFPASSHFMVGDPVVTDDGTKVEGVVDDDWMACDDCHTDVEGQDWAAIASRYIARFPGDGVSRSFFISTYEAFAANRAGPPVRM